MPDNLTLQVMRNLAARQGYHPSEAPADAPGVGPAHLDKKEEQMLLRAIGQQERRGPQRPEGPKAAGGMMSLDELAAQKR